MALEQGFVPDHKIFAPRWALTEFASSHADNMPAAASASTVRERGARTLTVYPTLSVTQSRQAHCLVTVMAADA